LIPGAMKIAMRHELLVQFSNTLFVSDGDLVDLVILFKDLVYLIVTNLYLIEIITDN
jgi:hypothetical protein